MDVEYVRLRKAVGRYEGRGVREIRWWNRENYVKSYETCGRVMEI